MTSAFLGLRLVSTRGITGPHLLRSSLGASVCEELSTMPAHNDYHYVGYLFTLLIIVNYVLFMASLFLSHFFIALTLALGAWIVSFLDFYLFLF